jgi:hypothetical protein
MYGVGVVTGWLGALVVVVPADELLLLLLVAVLVVVVEGIAPFPGSVTVDVGVSTGLVETQT